MNDPITESGGTVTESGEASLTGRMRVQVITAGLGSSGYYSPAVLEAAVRNRLIKRGTPLHVDHASSAERRDRPERSINTIAGVFTGEASYDASRQAIMGDVQVFSSYRERLAEMAPYIGLSISGSATDIKTGTVEGRQVPLVENLAAIDSVDFVTRAGRGGMVLLAESATSDAVVTHVTAEFGQALQESGFHIVPVTPPVPPQPKEKHMPEIEESRLRQLEADAGRVATLTSERDTAVTERDTAVTERDALTSERDALRLSEAQRTRTDRATVLITERATAARVTLTALEQRGLMADLPVTEAGALDEAAFGATVDTAVAETLAVRGANPAGQLTGFGQSGPPAGTPTNGPKVHAFGRKVS